MIGVKAKMIRLKEETYERLRDSKFELRLDTFDEVVMALIEEHEKHRETTEKEAMA